MSKKYLEDTLLVSISMSKEDTGVLVVGRKRKNGSVDIINAFQGDDAKRIYDILLKKSEK